MSPPWSSDLSRQVGAVVANRSGDVVASGANDAPAAGGGTYWPSRIGLTDETGDSEGPDYLRGYDSNERERNSILVRVIAALIPDEDRLPDDAIPEVRAALVKRYKDRLRGTGILDLTEFGRAVHAEMAALMSCARSGVTPVGGDAVLHDVSLSQLRQAYRRLRYLLCRLCRALSEEQGNGSALGFDLVTR